MFRFVVLCGLIAVSQAGYSVQPGYPIGHSGFATPAITSQQSNILRSYGNLGQVSTFSKTIDTPYSSVSKSDVRVSNPGYATVAHGPAYGYAAPAAYAAPAYAHAAYAAPAYAAPAYAHAAYAAPAYAHGPVVAKTVAAPGLLGVAYSAAPAVAHMTYSNGLGFNYAW